MNRRRTFRVLGTAAGVILLTPVMLAMAIMTEPPTYGPKPPVMVVAQLDKLAKKGDWAAVHRLIDFRAKGQRLVPDLWEPAPDADRQAFAELLKGMFQDQWEKMAQNPIFVTGPVWTTTEMHGPDQALVEQIAMSSGREYALRYWLARRANEWVVVDRTRRVGRRARDPRRLVATVRRKVATQLGREPTLREFTANASSWLGNVRTRSFSADDLIPK